MMLSFIDELRSKANPKKISLGSNRFWSGKTDRYIVLGALGIALVFLGIFVLVIGLALITYSKNIEQGIPGIIVSLFLFAASIFAILISTRRIKLPTF
jgi:hypothetical protein